MVCEHVLGEEASATDRNALLRKAFLSDLARRTGFAGRLLLARTS